MPRRASVNADLIKQCPIGDVLGQLPSSSRSGAPQQIRVVSLNDGQHLDSCLYRLEKGTAKIINKTLLIIQI